MMYYLLKDKKGQVILAAEAASSSFCLSERMTKVTKTALYPLKPTARTAFGQGLPGFQRSKPALDFSKSKDSRSRAWLSAISLSGLLAAACASGLVKF